MLGTRRTRAEIVVEGDTVFAHKQFLDVVWWGGGFPVLASFFLPKTHQLVPQQDESGKGGLRQVPGFIQEEILDAKLGEYIEYTLKRKVFMPISYHCGRVSFHQERGETTRTRVVWEVSYTPLPVIGGLFLMFTAMFSLVFLPTLQRACQAEKKKKKRQN